LAALDLEIDMGNYEEVDGEYSGKSEESEEITKSDL
jgi:hypothetical protein